MDIIKNPWKQNLGQRFHWVVSDTKKIATKPKKKIDYKKEGSVVFK